MSRRVPVGLTMWLLLLALAHVFVLTAVYGFFVRTARGQSLDLVAYAGRTIGHGLTDQAVDNVLGVISVASLALTTAVIGFIALVRRRVTLAVVVVVMIIGSNLTTQILKMVLPRPELVTDSSGFDINGLPSGHATVAVSVAVALTLVLPQNLRGIASVAGAWYAGFVSIATLSAGWHRPSDAVAAAVVVGGWAAVASVVLAVRSGAGTTGGDEGHPMATALLSALGVTMLAVAAVALVALDQLLPAPVVEVDLGWRERFVAYAGSSAGIAGTVSLVMMLVVVTVHRVVPGAPPGWVGVVGQTARSDFQKRVSSHHLNNLHQ